VAQITVKVDLTATSDPVRMVRDALRELRPDLSAATVSEVFPGVRSGRRAGQVVVNVPEALSATDAEALAQALRARAGVLYAQAAAARRAGG
jgi:hypothetical protein